MSVITDLIIYAYADEQHGIDHLNETFFLHGGLTLIGPREAYGGNKVASHLTWGGAFNYLDVDGLLEAARVAPWRFPEWVTVVYHDENDGPSVWMPSRGHVLQDGERR